MKAYKVFRVYKGELRSAFEGWSFDGRADISPSKRCLCYKDGEVAKDVKGCNHPGLMILMSPIEARQFHKSCPTDREYVLHEVSPRDKITPYSNNGWDFNAGFVSKLLVGKRIKSNKIRGIK